MQAKEGFGSDQMVVTVDKRAALAVFSKALRLKASETCLIVTDPHKEHISEALAIQARSISGEVDIQMMPPADEHGCEPPLRIGELMKQYDVAVLVTSRSLTHTRARREATDRGVRIASMPDISVGTLNRCVDIDYEKLRDVSRRLCGRLSETGKVRILTAKGTDLEMEPGGQEFFGANGGLLDHPGAYGNLPEGEVAFAPSGCRGRFVVDGSFPGFGMLKEPLCFNVDNGRVTGISGAFSEELRKRLDRVGPDAYVVAELGIGLNPRAVLTGNVLEDEKVIGTAHVALGNNLSFGGDNDVPVHLDGIILHPSIYFDEHPIMRAGKFERWL